MTRPGVLYIVATPIGNPEDITFRALDTLRHVDFIVCEEIREGSKRLKKYSLKKELISLNEHNEVNHAPQIVQRLVEGQSGALISDCGTPVFADPGSLLVQQATSHDIDVIPVPGASSLMAALSVVAMKLDRFFYAGFLPRKDEERKQQLKTLKGLRTPIVIMDAPYRLGKLLEEVEKVFSPQQNATLAVDLTLPTEYVYRGKLEKIRLQVGKLKGEFVLIIHP